ncbi:MAG TPA: DUF72 domain-containing protein [Acidobacteriaceae bacterium]|nr:DUF72 domain-containing protein [Acidobacteriaceae bacterium]
MSHGKVYIGISGWRYQGWRGVFYPEKLPHRRELEFASRKFNTIELNGSFYSLQRPQSFLRWSAETPEDFMFSVKGSRYITHMLRLRNVEGALANFFAQGLLHLEAKLGPILWQFPANFTFEPERIEDFLAMLPRTHTQAADLARRHDERMRDRSWFQVQTDAPLRHAMEIRHESFANERFIRLLRRYGVGLVVADTVEWPLLMDITSSFVYCRLHGSEVLYTSGYEEEAIEQWARRIVIWAQGGEVSDGRKACKRNAVSRKRRDVYVYFDNDIKVRAPFDAEQLRVRVNALLSNAAAVCK